MSIEQLSRTACIAVTNIEPFCHHEAAEAVGDLRQALNNVEDSQGQAVLKICEAVLRTTAPARGHRSKTMIADLLTAPRIDWNKIIKAGGDIATIAREARQHGDNVLHRRAVAALARRAQS